MHYIGIDLGTSAVKLILVNENGEILKIVSESYPLMFPHPGWSEQDPEEWWSAVKKGLSELLVQADGSQIKGIGVGGQMHGLVVLDQNDQVIRPAILWNDGRTQKETDYLNNEIGRETLSRYTGNIAFAGFTAPKILWMKANEPELFARIKKIMLPKDYINYKLTGCFATDYSDASGTLLLDVAHKCWSEPMLKICSVKKEQMPQLYESYASIGTVKQTIAEQFKLSEDTVVCAGAGDNAAAAVGCGAVRSGRCNISLGTSGTVFITSDEMKVDSQNALHSFAHANGRYHLMGCILSGASCNQWWTENILQTNEYEKEQASITADQLGHDRVYYLPYLMGERSPHNDSYARSCFIGMELSTTRADMTQAMMEGVAFAIRDCIEVARQQGITVAASTICGGGAKSPLWRSIMADVLNLPLEIPETEQGPGYGAAMLASVACGTYKNVEAASDQMVKIKDTVEPDAEIVREYEKRYQIWHQLYPALKPMFKKMGEAQ